MLPWLSAQDVQPVKARPERHQPRWLKVKHRSQPGAEIAAAPQGRFLTCPFQLRYPFSDPETTLWSVDGDSRFPAQLRLLREQRCAYRADANQLEFFSSTDLGRGLRIESQRKATMHHLFEMLREGQIVRSRG
jgi:hypothetical protein